MGRERKGGGRLGTLFSWFRKANASVKLGCEWEKEGSEARNRSWKKEAKSGIEKGREEYLPSPAPPPESGKN